MGEVYRCFFHHTKTDSKTFYLAEQVTIVVDDARLWFVRARVGKKSREREKIHAGEDDRYKRGETFVNRSFNREEGSEMMLLLVLLFPLVNAQQSARLCGTMLPAFSTNSRIVGGEPAEDGAWPWQVSISVNGRFICGGTLVSQQHVITAGHCIVGLGDSAGDFYVRVGAHNNGQGYYSGTVYRAANVDVHERYVSAQYGFDIAVITLPNRVPLSDTVNVACLPTSTNFFVPMYSPLVITGFGLTSEDGSLPYSLQQAIIQQLPSCANAYSGFSQTVQVCAGLQGGGRDTCQGTRRCHTDRANLLTSWFLFLGDSGGPLIYQPARSNQWTLVGITSYGNGCARYNFPGVYTRVSAYLSWIQNKIR